MKFRPYHKIRQFKDVVRDVQFKANYKGKDENGNAIYEDSSKPVLMFVGTVKLHGTNAGICYTPKEGIKAQKRSTFLGDRLNAHFGFNQFVQVTKKTEIEIMMHKLWETYCSGEEQITLYGEWAGNDIQKGVAISELPKAFYYFDAKVYNPETEEERWVSIATHKSNIEGIYNIYQFPAYNIMIDFNNPSFVQNELAVITENVEKECPVAKQLGVSGIGEGVVWHSYYKGDKLIFKVKGQKHSVSKVKKLANVDPEVLKNIQEFVEYACTPNRVKQGMQEVNATEKKDTGNLLKWIANDIIAEETDTLIKNNLEWKQVAKEVSNRARQIFFNEIDKL